MQLTTAFQQSLPDREWPRLARHGVVVASTDLEPWRPWLEDAWNLLDEGQRQRAQRQRRASDRESLTLAYALHRMLLGEALGFSAADVPLYRDASGCPRIEHAWGHTSLSHCEGMAAFAITGTGPVGVDLEPDSRSSEMPGIAERICTPQELQHLARLPKPEQGPWLLELWVRKEAYLKAEGVGLARQMPDFDAPADRSIGSESTPGTFFKVQKLDAGPDSVLAVAARPESPVHSGSLTPSAG